MKHERTFGSLQTDGITSKNYFPQKKLEISFWWDFSKMPNRVEKKKNHWLPTMQWSDIFVIDCFVLGEGKKMADNNTHEMDNTKGLAPKTYGYVCAIRVKRRVSAWKIGHLLLDCRFQETASLASNLIRREEKPRPTAHADQQS